MWQLGTGGGIFRRRSQNSLLEDTACDEHNRSDLGASRSERKQAWASRADARVQILAERLQAALTSDKGFQQLEAAARAVHEIQGLEPTFGYLSK
jgi:hypothetical protein